MVDSPSGGASATAPRWDLMDIEGYGGGNSFSVAPLTYLLRLYILPYPENNGEHHENLIPPPQPSVSARSHLGAFIGTLPEGESTMEGLYIISKASSMSCE